MLSQGFLPPSYPTSSTEYMTIFDVDFDTIFVFRGISCGDGDEVLWPRAYDYVFDSDYSTY